MIAYLTEAADAKEVAALIGKEGRKAVLVEGDLRSADHRRAVVDRAVSDLGGIDILVNNAAHQATFADIGDISDDEWRGTFEVNIHAMFFLVKAAVPHMKPGGSIINTAPVNATTKGAVQNFTGGLAQMLAERGIRVNAVAPGSIWTSLIPSTMPEEAVESFGKQVPLKRVGQPAGLATAYVMLADPLSSYTSGSTVAVTGNSRSSDEMAGIKHPVTPDGRYFVVKRKLWRLSDPDLKLREKAKLMKSLMDARRAAKEAKSTGDRDAELEADRLVDEAKRTLSERGPV